MKAFSYVAMLFGERSGEAFHIRRVVRDELMLRYLLLAKLMTVVNREEKILSA